jgi:iron complex outermembrane recepter protein
MAKFSKRRLVAQYISADYTESYQNIVLDGTTTLGKLGTSFLTGQISVPQPSIVAPNTVTRTRTIDRTLLATDRIDIGSMVTLFGGANIASVQNRSGGDATFTSTHQSAVTPVVALLVRPVSQVTTYFSYIQALEPGTTAPAGSQNQFQLLSPFVGDQYELGVKVNVTPGLTVGADIFMVN